MTDDAFAVGNAELPVDPDVDVDETATGSPIPVHLRPIYLGLVFVGGLAGTAAREGLALAFPWADGVPYTILVVNVLGAFLLGVLIEALAGRGPDHGRRRAARLLLGTGVLGGFTTYSALATDTARLIGNGSAGAGVGYGLATLLIGGLATWAGVAVGVATHSSRKAVMR